VDWLWQVALLVCSLHSQVNHTLVEYFTFRLDASFLHDLSEVDDCVVGVNEDFVATEVASTAV
jgi:hypothetical protein